MLLDQAKSTEERKCTTEEIDSSGRIPTRRSAAPYLGVEICGARPQRRASAGGGFGPRGAKAPQRPTPAARQTGQRRHRPESGAKGDAFPVFFSYICCYERTIDFFDQRRRFRFTRHGGPYRHRPPIRTGGRRRSRKAAERHEPRIHDALAPLHPQGARGGGIGSLRAQRHAGRLREGRFRLPAPRAQGRPGAFRHQPRLQFGRGAALFGHDGRCDRRKLLRLSLDRAIAYRPSPRRRFHGGQDLGRTHRPRRAGTPCPAAAT